MGKNKEKDADKEMENIIKTLNDDVLKLVKENERLRMENSMMFNRLRVINRAATNYTIQFDNDGMEVSPSDFKTIWNKEHGTDL